MRVEQAVTVAADRRRVFDVLADWERQAEWMVDALAVEVLTPQRQGVGVTVRCPTRILGLVVDDILRVTRFEPPVAIEAVHLGRIITGIGGFELEDAGGGTRVTWWEEVDPPLGRLGERVARLVVRPLVAWTFGRSLRRFKDLVEAEARAT